MIKCKIAFRIFLLAFIVIFFADSVVRADGLEAEEAATTSNFLDAPPPPVVEEDIDFLLPLELEEPLEEVSTPPQEDLWPSISQGMILLKPIPDGKILASEDKKELLGQGDLVYLSSNGAPFFPDEEWLVFKSVKDVFHPKTGALLGELVYVLGTVRAIDAKENFATAEIVRSKDPIRRGDQIASIERFVSSASDKVIPPENGKEGFIVEVRDNRKNNAQNDIVYIDYGEEEGITRGDQFVVIHEGVRSVGFLNTNLNDDSLPFRNIGRMVVLSTQAHTATAKITQSREPIEVGDTILFDSSESFPE